MTERLWVHEHVRKWAKSLRDLAELDTGSALALDPEVHDACRGTGPDHVGGEAELPVLLERTRLNPDRARGFARFRGLVDNPWRTTTGYRTAHHSLSRAPTRLVSMNAARSSGAIRIAFQDPNVRERALGAEAVHGRRTEAEPLGRLAHRQESVTPAL